MWIPLTRLLHRWRSAFVGRTATSPQAVQTALLQLASQLLESVAQECELHSRVREPLESHRRVLKTEYRQALARLEVQPDEEGRLILEDTERQQAMNSAKLDGLDERLAQRIQTLWTRQRHLGLGLIGRLESSTQSKLSNVDRAVLNGCLERIAPHLTPALPAGQALSSDTLHPLERGKDLHSTSEVDL